jgi:hypothetical protein
MKSRRDFAMQPISLSGPMVPIKAGVATQPG